MAAVMGTAPASRDSCYEGVKGCRANLALGLEPVSLHEGVSISAEISGPAWPMRLGKQTSWTGDGFIANAWVSAYMA